MDISLERESTAMGSIFQQIINDMKNSSPIWEDFIAKASKLHSCFRSTIQAIAAYLDAFQKIADAATNSRGATKEIGTALTRVCLRHKAVETRMKSFTTAIMDCLIIPLQEKLEEWRRQVAVIDKDHAKEHKRCRNELKKRSSDTLRLQKKAKKGQSDTIQSLVESSMQDINQRRAELEDVERKSLRAVMVEERSRYCAFVNMLQPVVKEECDVMYELGHLQEAMDSIAIVTKDPNVLPHASEELILETKASISLYPESPGGSNSHGGCSNSLGSRKSSVCSISSMNSSGSSGSPGHQYQRSLSQLISPVIRLKPGESSDSGFCSSSALTSQSSTSASTNQTHTVSTWPPSSQDITSSADRPHTISTAYEKGHQRPALTVFTFQHPEMNSEGQKSPATTIGCRPPLPIRCSSLERPLSSTPKATTVNSLVPRQCPSPIPAHLVKEHPILQPTYVNMSELASMAASKITNHQLAAAAHAHAPAPAPPSSSSSQTTISSPVLSIASSLVSSDSSATNHQSSSDISDILTPQICSPQTNESLPETPIITRTIPPATAPGTSTYSCMEVDGVDMKSIYHENNQTSSTAASSATSPDDLKSVGSVLEKLSIFEKQLSNNVGHLTGAAVAAAAVTTPAIKSSDLFNRKNEEIYKASGGCTIDKDSDQLYEDSIQQLNLLIGELDSFQKEHESKMVNHSNNALNVINKQDQINDNDNDDNDDDDCSDSITCDISPNATTISNNNSHFDSSSISSINLRNQQDLNTSNMDQNNTSQMSINNSTTTTTTTTTTPSTMMILPTIQIDTLQLSENYIKDNAEIVVFRRKENVINDVNNKSDQCYSNQINQQQQQQFNNYHNQQQLLQQQQQQQQQQPQQRFSSFKSDFVCPTMDENKLTPPMLNPYQLITKESLSMDSIDIKCNPNDTNVTISKPLVLPRPTSLSGCISRVARRSSINSTKPPPPVRRSSSVTPNHQINLQKSPSLSQQNLMNVSSESLPPPPAYLLDSSGRTSPGKVGETVKALTELRHMPASPGVIRRAQALAQMNQNVIAQNHEHSPTQQTYDTDYIVNSIVYTTPTTTTTTFCTQNNPSNFNDSLIKNSSYKSPTSSSAVAVAAPAPPSSQSGIYAQPKQVSKMSSFKNMTTNSTTTKQQNANLINQLNARLAPNTNSNSGNSKKIEKLPSNSELKSYAHVQNQQQIYEARTGIPTQQQQQKQQQQHYQQQQQRNEISQKQLQQQQQQQQRQNIYSNRQHQQQQLHQQMQQHYQQQQQLQLQQQQQQQHHHTEHNQMYKSPTQTAAVVHHPKSTYPSTETIYTKGNDRNYHYSQQQQQQPSAVAPAHHHLQHHNQYPSQAINDDSDKSTNARAKVKVGFLENLNAKLAEQRLSGKAFAVRSLINSKALPDPRICHESLMDQIKKGATLKRNKSINDRSAPKIH